MNKVVVISSVPIMSHMTSIFRMDALLAAGIEIVFWDIGKLVYKEYDILEAGFPDLQKTFYSATDVDKQLFDEDTKNTLFFLLCGFDYTTYDIFNLLRKHSAMTAYSSDGAWYKFCDIEKKRRIQYFLQFPLLFSRHVYGRLKERFLKIKHDSFTYDFIFEANGLGDGTSRTILCNAQTYDLCKFYTSDTNNDNPYCVYLDCAITHHPDTLQISQNGFPNADAFFSAINTFFDKVENDTGIQVIIAAHPKASYAGHEFNGRKIIQNNTAPLVKNAQFVINGYSTSGLFALALDKPLCFITSDGVTAWSKKAHPVLAGMRDIVTMYATSLNAPLYTLEHAGTYPKFTIPVVDKQAYTRERYKWLTHPETENTPSDHIFVEEIKKMTNNSRR